MLNAEGGQLTSDADVIRASVAALPDEELKKIASVACGRYPTPTLLAAIAELERRGVALPEAARNRPPSVQREDKPPRKGWFAWANPKIDDEASALRAARQGAVAAWIVTGLAAVFGLLSFEVEAFAKAGFGIGSLLESALFGWIGFRIWRGSLLFAIAGLTLYTIERVYDMVEAGRSPRGVAILLILAFANGCRGAWAVRKYRATGSASGKSS